MKFVYLTHSIRSCWNHGNAHFLRGVLRELIASGHDVVAAEPERSWSVDNLLRDHGEEGLAPFGEFYPELAARPYDGERALETLLDDADVVIVHEWNDPAVVAAAGALRRGGGRFRLFFHDTHHRAASDPGAMRAYDLESYDGVLAFGETVAAIYRGWGWGGRVHVWHEAADTRLFRPPEPEGERRGLVWIGNWGDGERSEELDAYLFGPATRLGLPLDIYGVRYPDHAVAALARHGASYHGWAPNPRAPAIFARHLATVHVPRRFYVEQLPGVPTIRVFEALACGIPLVSAPWQDSEGLFRVGRDFLMAQDPAGMEAQMRAVRDDADLRDDLARCGLETIRARHTCTHRAAELLAILDGAEASVMETA